MFDCAEDDRQKVNIIYYELPSRDNTSFLNRYKTCVLWVNPGNSNKHIKISNAPAGQICAHNNAPSYGYFLEKDVVIL